MAAHAAGYICFRSIAVEPGVAYRHYGLCLWRWSVPSSDHRRLAACGAGDALIGAVLIPAETAPGRGWVVFCGRLSGVGGIAGAALRASIAPGRNPSPRRSHCAGVLPFASSPSLRIPACCRLVWCPHGTHRGDPTAGWGAWGVSAGVALRETHCIPAPMGRPSRWRHRRRRERCMPLQGRRPGRH